MPNTTGSRANRPNPAARGLDYAHQKNRERMLMRHVDGTPCYWCSLPMFKEPARNPDGRALHADHSRSRSQYGTSTSNHADRLLHAACNESRGDGTRDHLRPALTAHQTTPTDGPDLGTLLYFDWPD